MTTFLSKFYWAFLVCLTMITAVGPVCAQTPQAAQTVAVPARITRAVDDTHRVTLRGNVHPLARAEFDQGIVPDAQPLRRILLVLQRSPEQEAALQALMKEQHDPSSPNYHAWVTPQEFGQKFGPADADVQAVVQWLQGQGFTINRVSSGRTIVEFSGTAGTVRKAFQAQMRHYAFNNAVHLANASDPQIPEALSPVVAGVVSLHNFPRKHHAHVLGTFRKSRKTGKISPLFTFPFNGVDFYGVTPWDFATIYNVKPLWDAGIDGTGQTIAIVGETNINVQDVQEFRALFNLPVNDPDIVLNGPDPGVTSTGEETEALLDVQWSGAVAKNAKVKFVTSASTETTAGVDLSAEYIIEHNLAGVMSESYGECELALGAGGNAYYNSLWQQAAAQGITVMVSSGDGGSAGCDNFNTQQTATRGIAVSGFASTPFNVSVGGTDFDQTIATATQFWNATNDPTTNASAKAYIPERPWNDSCAQNGLTSCSANSNLLDIVAGGGGPSSIYLKPSWQSGTGVPTGGNRNTPDVSLMAGDGLHGSFYIICQKDANGGFGPVCGTDSPFFDFQGVGGTSASSPAFAGIMALVNQKMNSRQGIANYVLYALAKTPGASCASTANPAATCSFYDVTKSNNSVPCNSASLNCSSKTTAIGVLVDPQNSQSPAWTSTTGYDRVTGLGTVNAANLINNWSAVAFNPTSTTLALSPTTGVTHGQNENVTVNVTVAPVSGTGTPTGDVSLIARLSDGTTLGLDGFTLTAGKVNGLKTRSLPGGTTQIIAHYEGDGSFASSDSAPVTMTVAPEASKTFLTVATFDPTTFAETNANATSFQYGSLYLLRMDVTDGAGSLTGNSRPLGLCGTINVLACPTGSVTLKDNGPGTNLNGATAVYPLSNEANAEDLTLPLQGGVHNFVATYSGDNSYTGSTTSATITVTLAPMFVDASIPATVDVGVPFTIIASGSKTVSNGAGPTGTVSVFDGTMQIGGPTAINGSTGSPSFFALVQATVPTPGDHTITVKYSGDSNYSTATSAPGVTRALLLTTTKVTASSTAINYGDSVTVTATVRTGQKSPAPTGQITFVGGSVPINGPISTTQSVDANGNVILQATAVTTPQFSSSIGAIYSGDSTYERSTDSSGVFISVDIPDFSIDPVPITLVALAGQTGTASITVTPATNRPSPVTFTFFGQVPTGTTLAFTPPVVQLNGSPVTAVITLSPGTSSAARALAHAQTSPIGLDKGYDPSGAGWIRALLSLLALVLAIGLTAKQRAYRAVAVAWMVFFVNIMIGCGGGGGGGIGGGGGGSSIASTTTTLTSTNLKVPSGQIVTLTAMVNSTNPVTGSVQFFDRGFVLGPPVAIIGGQAQMSQVGLDVGIHTLTAQYGGDSRNKPSTSGGLSQVFTGSNLGFIHAQTGNLTRVQSLTLTIN